MSRVAKKPIVLPENVKVTWDSSSVSVSGPKGELSMLLPSHVHLLEEDQVLRLELLTQDREVRAQGGRVRAQLNNMVIGTSAGFQKILDLVGVGYRVSVDGKLITLSLGYSHPVYHTVPEGITAQAPTNTQLVLSGIDKNRVTQEAAIIRNYRKPEPYKGKGVRYLNEKILRKQVKKK